MGLQVLFVVETNSQCKSDWIYIKDTIEYFYTYDQEHVRIRPVYMNGKGRYTKKDKDLSDLTKTFAKSTSGHTVVMFCFDCDDYDSKHEDAVFLDSAKKYCEERGYHFVWFCRDIESVYLGRQVMRKDKKRYAEDFKRKNAVHSVNTSKLMKETIADNASNLMYVIDRNIPEFQRKT